MQKFKRQFITAFFLFIFLFALFVLLYPFVYSLTFGFISSKQYIQPPLLAGIHLKLQDNILIIPKIGVKANIIDGSSLDILNTKEGVWHDPLSHAPDQQGITILAGHRFQYLPPNTTTLYFLDKLHPNDLEFVIWKSKLYTYQIDKIIVVSPYDTNALYTMQKKSPYTLIVYTCTPLLTAQNRLIVQSHLL